jgi:arabinan endo-1,5-alpha-L-arabinosidase
MARSLPVARAHLIKLLALLALLLGGLATPVAAKPGNGATYVNPLPVTADGTLVESCADPSVIRGGDGDWYMYCTTDPLSGDDRDANGNLIFHLIPTFSSADLVNWTYEGDAFAERPAYAAPTAGLWAPEIDYFDGVYYLFYGVTDVDAATSGAAADCPNDNAIGVATSTSPTGPWTHQAVPVVYPRPNGPPAGCNFFWTFDPEVIQAADGRYYIYYGSYYGGIFAQELTLTPQPAVIGPATQVTIANRYEGAEVAYRDGYYYLFVSATDCCRGPLTGYSIFVGRSTSPTGPFVDREGVSLLAGRVGGTPVISMNGNEWIGMGHNTVFQDAAGDWWTIYHAVDRNDPYFAGAVGFTKRPALLDHLDWIDGWPTVNAGAWASDTPQKAPAAQEGDKVRANPRPVREDRLGQLVFEEGFDDGDLSGWSWVREPAAGSYGVDGGAFSLDTQAADLFVDSNNASVLTAPLPGGNYVIETAVRLNLPPEGCCFNYVQAGLVVYGDDDNFIKLTHVSIWETRQTEFAKEEAPVPAGYPRYGNTVVGPPGDTTYLRIVRRMHAGEEQYTAYTSTDGQTWVRGGTWTHTLGQDARVGLVAMGGSGFTAEFDYVRVYRLR